MGAKERKFSKRDRIILITGILCVLLGAIVIFMMGSNFSKSPASFYAGGVQSIFTVFSATGLTIFGFWLLLKLGK